MKRIGTVWLTGFILSVLMFSTSFAQVENGEDAENPVPSIEDAYPVPPSALPFAEGFDKMLDRLGSGEVQPQFFIGKKYRYCQVAPIGHNQVACSNCTSRGLGGEAGRAYCGARCGKAGCSVRYGRCSEPRNIPPC